MAGITGLGQKIDAARRVTSTAGDFSQGVAGITGAYTGAAGSTAMSSDFIGMDYTQVETIRTAIREYVTSIQNALERLRTETNANQAFHGEIKTAAENYVSGVVESANAYTSQLLEFSDKMQQAYKAFITHESDVSAQINTQGKEASTSTQTYTEQE